MEQRARGALLGTLIGDALGRPFEGTPKTDLEVLRRRVVARIADPCAFGHSDDGEMMLNLAESLASRGEIDEQHLLEHLARGHDPARGYGKGARAAFRVWEEGGRWEDAGRVLWSEGSRGNGGAVRVAPIAVRLIARTEEAVAIAARRSATPTHVHEEAVAAAAIVAVAVHRALHADDISVIVRGLESLATGLLADRIVRIESLTDATANVVVEQLGHGIEAVGSVPAALWAALGSVSFEDAVLRAVCLGGDTDSIGAMAGAIAGAFYGGSIPEPWIAALEPSARTRAEASARALLAPID